MPKEPKRPFMIWFDGRQHVIPREEYFRNAGRDHIDANIRQAAERLGVRVRVSVYRDRVIVQTKPEPSWTEIAETR